MLYPWATPAILKKSGRLIVNFNGPAPGYHRKKVPGYKSIAERVGELNKQGRLDFGLYKDFPAAVVRDERGRIVTYYFLFERLGAGGTAISSASR